jgi:hypothetical protein
VSAARQWRSVCVLTGGAGHDATTKGATGFSHFDDVAHGGRTEHSSVSACRMGFLGKDDAVRSTETASGEAASVGSVMMADKWSALRVRRRLSKRYAYELGRDYS